MQPGDRLNQYVERRQKLAWLALAWERAWPALAPLVGVIGLFVAVALMDILPALAGWLHVAVLAVFALAAVAAIVWMVRYWRRPTDAEARRRLETASDLPHRPLAVLDDDLVTLGDMGSRALWEAHRRRAAAALAGLKVGWPRPRLPAMDPNGLRAIVFLALAVGLTVGWAEPGPRLARALTPDFSGPAGVPAELEAWINPPSYTDMAPFPLAWPATGDTVKVPTGAKLLARLYGGQGVALLRLGDDPAAAPVEFRQADTLNREIEHELTEGTRLRVMQGEAVVADWPIEIVPDLPPVVTFAKPPSATKQMALRLDHEATDDYGLASLHARIELADEAAPEAGGEPLRLDLPLPGINAREAGEPSFHDLTAHPWAGLKVRVQLVAEDEIEQRGVSEAVETVLPAREFTHPVARALIEQRRILNRGDESRGPVILALSAISTGPDTFDHDLTVYMTLRSAIGRLRYDRTATAIPETQELLWQGALRLEDGRLSLAQRDLRRAQQALMDALARDADEAEIQRLMDELQNAIDKYLQAMAEQAMRQAEQGQEPGEMDPNAKTLNQDDLKRMLDRARELAQLGAKDAAREMLRQLQEMLENLQAGRMQQMPQQAEGMQQQMQELGDLMRKQQELLDKTYRESQRGREGQMRQGRRGEQPGQQNQRGRKGQRQPGADGQDPSGQPGEQPGSLGDMAGNQEALRQRLAEILRQLNEAGAGAPNALGRAEQHMGGARDALRQGQPGPAAQDQTKALDELAQGMRGMAEELARQMGDGEDGEGNYEAREEDPLGRTTNSGGVDTSRVEIPTQSDLQRAREILDELRRRAGERGRPDFELDYIERLLRRF
ncbi:MAG: TIGR02302 family protein [Alphaproteobacteria bacterium]